MDVQRTFTTHEKAGYGNMVLAVCMILAVEVMPIHLLVHQVSPWAAWGVTLSTVLTGVWFVRDYRALRDTPIEVRDGMLFLRTGRRWSADIPLDLVESARLRLADDDPADLDTAIKGAPRVRLAFREPVTVRGPVGYRKSARVLDLGVDGPEEFLRAIG